MTMWTTCRPAGRLAASQEGTKLAEAPRRRVINFAQKFARSLAHFCGRTSARGKCNISRAPASRRPASGQRPSEQRKAKQSERITQVAPRQIGTVTLLRACRRLAAGGRQEVAARCACFGAGRLASRAECSRFGAKPVEVATTELRRNVSSRRQSQRRARASNNSSISNRAAGLFRFAAAGRPAGAWQKSSQFRARSLSRGQAKRSARHVARARRAARWPPGRPLFSPRTEATRPPASQPARAHSASFVIISCSARAGPGPSSSSDAEQKWHRRVVM